jgi:hypothetical protein
MLLAMMKLRSHLWAAEVAERARQSKRFRHREK